MSITLKNLNITVSITADEVSTASRPQNSLAAALMAALAGAPSGSVSVHTCSSHDDEQANPEPQAAAPEGNGTTEPAPAPTRLTPADVQSLVMDALHDERYDLRTFDGLAKAVQNTAAPTPVTTHDVQDAVDTLVDEGVVYTRRRRSDGATLYGAA